MIREILTKVDQGQELSQEDALTLLNCNNHSEDFCKIMAKANEQSRRIYHNRGYIFAQIGINASPCSGNCKFCSLAKDNYTVGEIFDKSIQDIVKQVSLLDTTYLDALFLMTTADYNFKQYVEIAKQVRKVLDPKVNLIANIGDFDIEKARILKEIGFHGVYHIVRLREGQDTDILPEQRIATLDAIKSVGLQLYYCIEPIGSEHSYEEIIEEMLRARKYQVDVMAIMGRTSVKGTKFEQYKELSELELTKIAAVTRLVTNPKKSMNIHEPKRMPLLAGVNQLYAEIGINPRDTTLETEKNRGYSIQAIKKMLEEAEYIV